VCRGYGRVAPVGAQRRLRAKAIATQVHHAGAMMHTTGAAACGQRLRRKGKQRRDDHQ